MKMKLSLLGLKSLKLQKNNRSIFEDTGKMPMGGPYDGPPIHTLTIFVNPFIEDPPSPTGEGVRTVEPGQHFYNLSYIFAYICANTRTSALEKLDFSQLKVWKRAAFSP